jgi:flagellar basal-body rod protein FlgG
MNRALYAAASGMGAEQENLDTIAANLANADITAFSGKMVELKSSFDRDGQIAGVKTNGTHTVFTQGKIEKSSGPCDLAIHGSGFFCVQRGHDVAYTRDGSFHRSADGYLENADGWHLSGIRVPEQLGKLTVATDGKIELLKLHGAEQGVGRITLAQFTNPSALQPITSTMYRANEASGKAHYIAAGQRGGAEILSGMTERSSVSIVEAMMEILDAQRAYEADAKGVQAADEMVRIANNLQRG